MKSDSEQSSVKHMICLSRNIRRFNLHFKNCTNKTTIFRVFYEFVRKFAFETLIIKIYKIITHKRQNKNKKSEISNSLR